jgi:hypothetical protein
MTSWQAQLEGDTLHISGTAKCPDDNSTAGLERVVEDPPQPGVMSYRVVFSHGGKSFCGPDLMGMVNHVEKDIPAGIARIRVLFDGGQVEIPILRKGEIVEREGKTKDASFFLTCLPIIVGVLSLIVQGIGINFFKKTNGRILWIASVVVFLIVAGMLVRHRIDELKRLGSSVVFNFAMFIVTVIVILVGAVMLWVAGFLWGMSGS